MVIRGDAGETVAARFGGKHLLTIDKASDKPIRPDTDIPLTIFRHIHHRNGGGAEFGSALDLAGIF